MLLGGFVRAIGIQCNPRSWCRSYFMIKHRIQGWWRKKQGGLVNWTKMGGLGGSVLNEVKELEWCE